MKKAVAFIFMTVIGLALLVFTGTRTLRLIDSTLPGGDAQVAGYLALVALDGGLVIWPLVYLHGSRGMWQRGIALIMVLVSFLGVVAAMVADTFLQAGRNGITAVVAPGLITSAIWLVTVIIALNIGAVVLMHLTSPENMLGQAYEEAQTKIVNAQLRAISENADALAAELAPRLGQDWRNTQRSQWAAGLGAVHKPQGKLIGGGQQGLRANAGKILDGVVRGEARGRVVVTTASAADSGGDESDREDVTPPDFHQPPRPRQ